MDVEQRHHQGYFQGYFKDLARKKRQKAGTAPQVIRGGLKEDRLEAPEPGEKDSELST